LVTRRRSGFPNIPDAGYCVNGADFRERKKYLKHKAQKAQKLKTVCAFCAFCGKSSAAIADMWTADKKEDRNKAGSGLQFEKGSSARTRTWNRSVNSRLLYRLSYRGKPGDYTSRKMKVKKARAI
jgi:hypothetical protein